MMRSRSHRAPALAVGALVTCLAAVAGAGPLNGRVLDGETMRPIAGATVAVSGTDLSTVTTNNGRFAFAVVAPGRVTVQVTAPDYEPTEETFAVDEHDTERLFLLLKPGSSSETIEVTEAAPMIPDRPGQQDLGREEITRIPGTRGDAISSIKSMPGVANADAAGAGAGLLVIRGAAPEDSKISIDGIEIPLVYHFFGLQSILPSEFIDTIEYAPGGFGADEGRATGGIINIVTRSEQVTKTSAFAELSFINLAAFIQAPVSKKHNVQISAGLRRSAIDMILPLVLPDSANLTFSTAPKYYDGQLRIDWRPKVGHRLTLLGLGSFDLLTLINDNINPNEPLLTGKWENETTFTRAIATWQYSGDRLESRVTGAAGTQGFRVEIGADRFIKGAARRVELRTDLGYRISRRLRLRSGTEARYGIGDFRSKIPLPPAEGGGGVPQFSSAPLVELQDTIGNHFAGAYVMADFAPHPGTRITPGVRVDYYDRVGAVTVTPRVTVRQRLADTWKLSATIGSYSRPLERVEALQTNLSPELATQYVVGAEHKPADGITASMSAFYTDRRQLVVQDAVMAARDPKNAFVSRGYGRSFGVEALVRVKRDKFFGWISYTLSRSDRVDSPTRDRRLFDFDQTHNLITLGSYTYGRWEFGARWQLSSGNPVTPVIGSIYQSDLNANIPILGPINSDRIDLAHQLDVRIDRKWNFDTWNLSAYLDVTNVYANPRVLGFTYNFDYSERQAIEELPIVPAIGLRGSY